MILDNYGNHVSFTEDGQPVFGELATTNDGRDITRGYVSELLVSQDPVLASQGGDLQVYEKVLRDDQVFSTFQQRRMAVTSCEWEVFPGGTKRIDKKAADFLQEVLENIRWDSCTEKMLFGVFYGYAVAECLWVRDGQYITAEAIKVRKQRRFRFDADLNLRLLTLQNPQGERMPSRKFWTFRTGADNDDEPYGLGLGHWLYWPVWFKRNGIKFWLIFLDKFGMPTAHGTYPRGATPDEQAKLLAALSAIQTDSGVITPEGMKIELIEAARSGSVSYDTMLGRMERAISKVVLSQTMTTDDGSSQSQAQVHKDVALWVIKSDADLVCASFNRGPVRWLTEWNFPGAAPPTVYRRVEEVDDLRIRSERDKNIHDMGFKPTLQHITDTYGGEWEARSQSSTPTSETNTPDSESKTTVETDKSFSEDEEPPIEQGYRDQAGDQAVDLTAQLLAPVRQLLDQVASLEELRDRLLEVYSDMSPADLGAMMQQVFTVAELAGRFEVSDGR